MNTEALLVTACGGPRWMDAAGLSSQSSRRTMSRSGALLLLVGAATAQNCEELVVRHGMTGYANAEGDFGDFDGAGSTNPFGPAPPPGPPDSYALSPECQSARIHCDAGHVTAAGASTAVITCDNGVWEFPTLTPCADAGAFGSCTGLGSPIVPTADTLCRRADGGCESLTPTDSGGANAGVFTYSDDARPDGSTASLHCNTGFDLRNPAAPHRTCHGGTWAADLPLIAPQVCDAALASAPWLQPHLPDSAACPIGDFRARLTAVDEACCAEGQCVDGVNECSMHCGAVFLSLYSTCNHTMTQLLDGMDGATDGVASVVADLHDSCLGTQPPQIIEELIRMRDEDGCTIHGDGVGARFSRFDSSRSALPLCPPPPPPLLLFLSRRRQA